MTTQVTLEPGLRGFPHGLGPMLVDVAEDGDLIRSARITMGFGRRSVERLMERAPYLAGQIFADKLDFASAPACSLGFAGAVEQIAGIRVPARAERVRVILLELNRIGHHLFFVAQMARLVGAVNIASFAMRAREQICDLLEMYSGSRLGFGAIRVGGVSGDLTEGMIFRIERSLLEVDAFVELLGREFLNSALLIDRLQAVGTIEPDVARDLGLLGPNARASGLDGDLRINRPEAGYRGIDLPLLRLGAVEGDALTRVRVRVAEIAQSSQILRKACLDLPAGNVRIEIGADFSPATRDAFQQVEGPKGALGFYVASSGGEQPACVRYAAPSLRAVLALPKLLQYQEIADLEIILCSLDISVSELDR